MNPRASLIALLSLTPLLAACPKRSPSNTIPAMPVSGVGMVSIQTTPEGQEPPAPGVSAPSETQARKRLLDASVPRVLPCYQAALARNPFAYGEILLRYSLNEDGSPARVETRLDTVGDPELVACVEGVVRDLRFAAPSRSGASDHYPFIFSTDRTPPEIVRAMKARHGFQTHDENPEQDPGDPERVAPPGTVETW